MFSDTKFHQKISLVLEIVMFMQISDISVTGCVHALGTTEGDVWENILRIIGCNAPSVSSNQCSKLIGEFGFSHVGQLFSIFI